MAVSKPDKKPSGTFVRKFACDLGFAGYVFLEFLPLEGDFSHEALRRMLTNYVFENK